MRRAVAIVALALVVGLVYSSAYVITEVQQVIITRLGKPIGPPIKQAGLKWKLPIIDDVNRFDKRWLEWDADPAEMPTREKNPIWVDTYARWRIADPLKNFTATKGDELITQSRLDGMIEGVTRNVIASHDLIEVVRSTNREFARSKDADLERDIVQTDGPVEITAGRDKLAQMILTEAAKKAMETLGVELVDIQFQRVNYTESVEAKVYDRMISDRKKIAGRYRSQGEGKQAEILGKKDFKLKEIESNAYREMQRIKGEADARATTIYAAAHNLEPGLYRMLKSLESYRKSIDAQSWVILSTDSDYLDALVSMPSR